jgi:hypothetical protein
MSVVIDGLAELDATIKALILDMDKAVDDAVRITAVKVQKNAIKSIREPSVGTHVTRYTASGKPYAHVASKPGDAPNNDTGRLMGSVDVDHKRGRQIAYVGTNVDYGFFLETVYNRPWLEPAKEEEVKGFKQNIIIAIDRQIKAI